MFLKKPSPKYCDKDMVEISQLFFLEHDDPTFGREYLDTKSLDYSVASLKGVDRYLDLVRKRPEITSVWNKVILRCGAYVGEVARRNCDKRELHWVDYENALLVDKKSFEQMVKSVGTAVSLYSGPAWFCFPLAKVDKYLENGAEDSVYSFVSVIKDVIVNQD